ncbi:TSF1 transcription factor-like protein [Elsinoe fawcettii]|nr:TSF1 transcription factor-like protein [Elsinoe fawcettii]
MGLITPETIAQDIANGTLPPDQTVAAEKVPLPIAPTGHVESMMHHHRSSPPLPQESSKSSSPSGSPTSISHNSTGSDAPPAPMFDQFNGCPTPPQGLSPTTPSGQGFNGPASFPGFDDYNQQIGKTSAEDCNPHFMLDWQQLQLPIGLDPMLQPDMLGDQDLNFDMGAMGLGTQMEPILSINPELTNNMPPPLITPIETPKFDRSSSDLDAFSSGLHDRQYSVVSNQSVDSHYQAPPQPDPVVVAQDGWNVFRCVPSVHPSACPSTARWNLEALESTLQNHDGWSKWRPEVDENLFDGSDQLAVMQIHESTRDKLLAITQGFLHKALEIHRGNEAAQTYAPSNFVLLPPTKVLEYFLRSYTNSFERFYPLTSKGSLDANELMFCYQDRASSLLILLMVAQGAMNVPSREARSLTGGLVETCRISLFDLIERNIVMASDHNVLHAALIFTELASWSGDKWQMDIAMGQRGMYAAMLRHSGVLDRTTYPPQGSFSDGQTNADHMWNLWIQQESRSRLVYSWAMVDQELALFHDTSPLFSVTEFGIALPHNEELWRAKSAGEWTSLMGQRVSTTDSDATASPPSLRDLFRRFLDDEMDSAECFLNPMHLRLLLLPLQAMVGHYQQLMCCFSDSGSSRVKNKTVTASSTRCRLEEVQCLLQRWYNIAMDYLKEHSVCSVMQASLVLYHLISLNAVTDFVQIERLARRETFDGTYQSLVWTHKRCITDVGEAIFHCGQVISLIRSMPRSVRPPWWAASIYRVALVLWCDSLIDKDGSSSYGGKSGQTFAVDALPSDHPLIQRYLNKGEGTPRLSKRDGSTIGLDHGLTVLNHCAEIIDEGATSRFQEGIRGKLDRLMRT